MCILFVSYFILSRHLKRNLLKRIAMYDGLKLEEQKLINRAVLHYIYSLLHGCCYYYIHVPL